jgi:hypothetical protein
MGNVVACIAKGGENAAADSVPVASTSTIVPAVAVQDHKTLGGRGPKITLDALSRIAEL